MKILSLSFKNINSLKGNSQINFDQAPLVDGGVFAITGPNGSGKSSILDAITLALYGETFRFDRPAEYVMTKETAESFSEVKFALGNEQYLASWQVSRKQGDASGELLPAKMKLVKVNGQEHVLEDSVQKVREKMIDLTGMDFHKFSKSMVLAQGDFSAFLNALDSERMDILEKISGTDIYADYQQQAEQIHQQAKTKFTQLEEDISAIPLLDAVTLESNELDLADFQEQQLTLKKQLYDIEIEFDQVKKVSELQAQITDLIEQQQQFENQKIENQKTLEIIESSQGLTQYEDQLTELTNKEDRVQQSKKTLDAYRNELGLLQNQLKTTGLTEGNSATDKTPTEQSRHIGQLKLKKSELQYELSKENVTLQSITQQLDESQDLLTETESWLQSNQADKSLVENFPQIERLRELRAELAEVTEKHKQYAKWTKNTTSALKKQKDSIDGLNKKEKELTETIQNGEASLLSMADGRSLDELQEMEVEQKDRVSSFIELYDLATVNAKLGKKNLFSQLFSKSSNKEEKQLKEESEHLQLVIGREQNVIKTLEQAVINEALLIKVQSDREHLVDGKPCPLCGALKHPYSKHAPAVSNSQQVLKEQQKQIKKLLADAEQLSKQMAAVKIQAEKDGKKDSQLQVVCSQWNSLANKLNIMGEEMDIDNLSLMKDLLTAEKKELGHISRLVKQFVKQQKTVDQAKETIQVNETSLTRLAEEATGLNAEWENRPQESIELEQVISKYQTEETVLAEKVEAQLQQLGEKISAKDNKLLSRLKFRQQEYLEHEKRQKTLAEEVTQQALKSTEFTKKVDEINLAINECSSNLKQEEVAGLHLSLVEKQKLIADKETSFSEQENDLMTLKQNVQQGIEGTHTGIPELRESLALIKQKPEIEKKQQTLTNKVIDSQREQEKLQSQLETEQAVELKMDAEAIQEQHKAIKEKYEIAKMEAETIKNKLNKQAAMQEKHKAVSTKLDSQKLVLEAAEVEINLMSDENGMVFRRKVKNEMADKLLSQTNQVLEKISGRYYLRKIESEYGLALEIEDTKQHNIRRLPKTLSGGESFVVSLSLALGLSEMASDDHAVDSLFIDEGFGNLDADSLYLAMTTLESLKTHGKVVGVISHVEGVRKRIKTQIEMKKNPNGFSEVHRVI